MAQTKNISVEKLMIIALASIIGGGTAMKCGGSYGSLASIETIFYLYCCVFGIVTFLGLILDHQRNKALSNKLQIRKNDLQQLANRHNQVTDMLEVNYRIEKQSLGFFSSREKEQLRQRYEQEYDRNRQAYERERKQLLSHQQVEDPIAERFRKLWKKIIVVGLLFEVAACSYTMGTASELESKASPQVVSNTAGKNAEGQVQLWTAETVPMPHLTDGSRYVSNPDHIVSNQTEQLLNHMLKKMDDSLQIESAMIIVNHVENKDIFRFAQDLFDRYHIGKDDKGLVIVLAYGDHQVRTHTGRSLEGDLTDVECSRLQQTYAIPFMKREQPDSGMIYLTESIYNTLKGKNLPQTDFQRKESEADSAFGFIALYMLLFSGWAFLIAYLVYRYNGPKGANLLRSNPFAKAPIVIVGGSGRSSGGGFGGGSFGGGGFSGGSSGGGGATSSW